MTLIPEIIAKFGSQDSGIFNSSVLIEWVFIWLLEGNHAKEVATNYWNVFPLMLIVLPKFLDDVRSVVAFILRVNCFHLASEIQIFGPRLLVVLPKSKLGFGVQAFGE